MISVALNRKYPGKKQLNYHLIKFYANANTKVKKAGLDNNQFVDDIYFCPVGSNYSCWQGGK
jgi:hypothetical protein